MSDPLSVYLHDHLSGATHAIELLQAIRDQYKADSLGEFAAGLLADVEMDRETLRNLAERVGDGSSPLKELAGWLSERVSRIKLGRGEDKLGTFEALEFLELGIQGKWALWRALEHISSKDPRLQGVDFRHLAERAETQRARVEQQRLLLAPTALLRRAARHAGA